jgi:hypothetical protein
MSGGENQLAFHPIESPETTGNHTETRPDHPKMPVVGHAPPVDPADDRATLDRATLSGNH